MKLVCLLHNFNLPMKFLPLFVDRIRFELLDGYPNAHSFRAPKTAFTDQSKSAFS